eukprot:COSAG02_NODE_2293_length_9198_cov_195.076492_1_plen_699_part_00
MAGLERTESAASRHEEDWKALVEEYLTSSASKIDECGEDIDALLELCTSEGSAPVSTSQSTPDGLRKLMREHYRGKCEDMIVVEFHHLDVEELTKTLISQCCFGPIDSDVGGDWCADADAEMEEWVAEVEGYSEAQLQDLCETLDIEAEIQGTEAALKELRRQHLETAAQELIDGLSEHDAWSKLEEVLLDHCQFVYPDETTWRAEPGSDSEEEEEGDAGEVEQEDDPAPEPEPHSESEQRAESLSLSMLEQEVPIREGFLMKKHKERKSDWQLRYFVLRGDRLEYKKKPSSKKLSGIIELHDSASRVSRGTEKSAKTISVTDFKPSTGESRTYKLRAESAAEADSWVLAIVQNTAAQDPKLAVGRKPHPRDATSKSAAHSGGEYMTCLDRPYVQKEIRWARESGKKIIILFEKESHRPGYFDHGKAAQKYAGTEWEFILSIDAIPYQRDQYLADAMLENILDKASTADIAAAENPSNSPGVWDFFLSHHQELGGDQMKSLSLLFDKKGKTAWYDNGQLDKSEPAMEEGVKHCKSFVLLLTAKGGGGSGDTAVSPGHSGSNGIPEQVPPEQGFRQGTLEKKGGGKKRHESGGSPSSMPGTPRLGDRFENQWKPRVFTLKQDTITYMSGESHGKERMYIPLGTADANVAIDPDHKTWIVLHDDTGRQWKLRAVGSGPEAEADAQGWVAQTVAHTQAQRK